MSPFGSKATDAPPSAEEDLLFGELLAELRDGLERTGHLMGRFKAGGLSETEREEARTRARYLAGEGRIGFMVLPQMSERAPELFPTYAVALRIVTRLAYCLLALADEDPEPLALLSPAELATILRDESGDERLEELIAMVPAERARERG